MTLLQLNPIGHNGGPPMEDRWYQTEAVDAIFDCLDRTKGNPLVGLPTGSGKSIVIARFIRRLLWQWSHMRVLVATHVKELIGQNYSKMLEVWPNAPAGICSAGLKSRVVGAPIVFGGVKTLLNEIERVGWRDVLIIDECHLLSPEVDTEYQKLISALRKINPYLRVIGLSATLFRSKQGSLTNDVENANELKIFTEVAYNMCTSEGFARLLAEGFLAMPIPKRTNLALDVSGVTITNGEYAQGQLQTAVEKQTYAMLQETCALAWDRHSWLVFAAGVQHAEQITSILHSFGVSAVCVHSKIKSHERDERIALHKSGKVKALVGMNIFTTGYDHPPLDCIVDGQPTLSVVKHVQKYGRGTRPYDWRKPGKIDPNAFPYVKENCLILDFARNTENLGPINDPNIREPGKKKDGQAGIMPIRICDKCGVYNHVRATHCMACNYEFEFEIKLEDGASTNEIVTSKMPVVEMYDVIMAVYNLYQKPGAADSMKVTYSCVGTKKSFQEWVGFENQVPYVRHRAHEWWKQRHPSEPPKTSREAVNLQSQLRTPKKIRVWMNTPTGYPEVMSYEY